MDFPSVISVPLWLSPMQLRLDRLSKSFGAQRVLDEISFTAPDRSGEAVSIDGAYVRRQVEDLARNTDLSRFIL